MRGGKLGNKGCLVAFGIVVGIVGFYFYGMKMALTPEDLSKADPRNVFESYVCSPPPASVHGIRADGEMAFTGSHVVIEFRLDPRDLEDLLRRGNFERIAEPIPEWKELYRPEGVTGPLRHYERPGQRLGRETRLHVTDDGTRAWFRETST